MASIVQDALHKEYLVLTDKVNNIWERLSFRTSASDVYLASGKTIQDIAPEKLEGVLQANTATIKLTSSAITTETSVLPFTSIFGVNPIDMKVETGVVTLTFDPQNVDMNVKLIYF